MTKTKTKKSKFPKTLTIKRSQWCRGNKKKYGDSALVNDKGFMCCLGFLGRACGLTDNQMLWVAEPTNFNNLFPVPASGNGWQEFMNINDSDAYSAADREQDLKWLFKTELGMKVRFVD